jgi:hypothetical protein
VSVNADTAHGTYLFLLCFFALSEAPTAIEEPVGEKETLPSVEFLTSLRGSLAKVDPTAQAQKVTEGKLEEASEVADEINEWFNLYAAGLEARKKALEARKKKAKAA